MKHKNYKKILLFFAVLGLCFMFHNSSAQAATFAVAGGNDTIAVDSSCSLSEAIQNINDQAQTNADCAAGDGNDTITLPNSTITLTGNLPSITATGSITISGSGPNSVIDGANTYASIVNTDSSASSMNISGFTVLHAYQGFTIGGQDCSVTNIVVIAGLNNSGIYCNGTLSVNSLDVTGASTPAGSGLMVEGNNTLTAVLDYVRVHDGIGSNSDKAPLYFQNIADLTVDHSEVSNFGCSGTCLFGGMTILGASDQDTAVIRNTSIVGNEGGIAGLFLNGDMSVTIQNITIADNAADTVDQFPMSVGGIIYISEHPGTVTLQNVLLSNNTASSGGSPSNCFLGTVQGFGAASIPTSLGGNLSDDTTCTASFNQSSDFNNVDAGLDSFELDGATKVYTLLATSPAVDGGTAILGVTDDQRGTSRPHGGGYDIGAYETTLAKVASGTGSGSSQNPSTQAGVAKTVPKVPDTGVTLIKNNPYVAAGASALAAIVLLWASRKYQSR